MNDIDTLFLLPGEKTIVTTKQHVFAIIPPLIIAPLLGALAILLIFSVSAYMHASIIMTLLAGSLIAVLTMGLLVKVFVDWYFHIYMVTDRRILEINYKPFFSQDVNDVLLDQVRCTEIDVQIHGYIHGLIDVGDIIITFDRPTHQQEFVLHDIKSPRAQGTLLGELLNTPKEAINNKTVWYKSENMDTNPYRFTEEIRPMRHMQIV